MFFLRCLNFLFIHYFFLSFASFTLSLAVNVPVDENAEKRYIAVFNTYERNKAGFLKGEKKRNVITVSQICHNSLPFFYLSC